VEVILAIGDAILASKKIILASKKIILASKKIILASEDARTTLLNKDYAAKSKKSQLN